MLLGLLVFGSLGTWQLNRSGERRAELDAFASAAAALPAAGLGAVPAGGGNRRVRLTGRYEADRQVLLDSMTHEGLRGYHVLTPLRTGAGMVLVNRGFVAGAPDRSQLPDIAVGEQRREITGMAAPYFRRGMRLETDPTVIYGLGDAFDGNLTKADLKRDTPYNTYTRKGLPPTPIAIAGAAAIDAVVVPLVDGSLYFVSKGDGRHVFSSNYDDHRKAVRRYQIRARRSERAAQPEGE